MYLKTKMRKNFSGILFIFERVRSPPGASLLSSCFHWKVCMLRLHNKITKSCANQMQKTQKSFWRGAKAPRTKHGTKYGAYCVSMVRYSLIFAKQRNTLFDEITHTINGLQLRHSFFQPKRLDVKTPLQSIGRYRKATYNSFSGHI